MSDKPLEPVAESAGVVGAESPISDIPDTAAILIQGPPMTGKYHLLLTVLAHLADSAIVLSTKHQADRIIADYQAITANQDRARIGVVDCASHHDTAETLSDSTTVKYASSPENLTRIGVKFTELFERFFDDPDSGQVGVGVHSISQLVMHANMKKVYQFLQVLTGQIRSANWFAAAVIDESVADDNELQTLQQHFDGVIETRESETGRREYRIRGFGPQSSDWTPF